MRHFRPTFKEVETKEGKKVNLPPSQAFNHEFERGEDKQVIKDDHGYPVEKQDGLKAFITTETKDGKPLQFPNIQGIATVNGQQIKVQGYVQSPKKGKEINLDAPLVRWAPADVLVDGKWEKAPRDEQGNLTAENPFAEMSSWYKNGKLETSVKGHDGQTVYLKSTIDPVIAAPVMKAFTDAMKKEGKLSAIYAKSEDGKNVLHLSPRFRKEDGMPFLSGTFNGQEITANFNVLKTDPAKLENTKAFDIPDISIYKRLDNGEEIKMSAWISQSGRISVKNEDGSVAMRGNVSPVLAAPAFENLRPKYAEYTAKVEQLMKGEMPQDAPEVETDFGGDYIDPEIVAPEAEEPKAKVKGPKA